MGNEEWGTEYVFPLKRERAEEEKGQRGDLVLCQRYGVIWLSREEATVKLYDFLWGNYDVSQRDYHYEGTFKGDEGFQTYPPRGSNMSVCLSRCLSVTHCFTSVVCALNTVCP